MVDFPGNRQVPSGIWYNGGKHRGIWLKDYSLLRGLCVWEGRGCCFIVGVYSPTIDFDFVQEKMCVSEGKGGILSRNPLVFVVLSSLRTYPLL